MQVKEKDHLIEEGGHVRFVFVNHSAERQVFLEQVAKYNIKRQGASLYFHDRKNNQLVAYFNSFDNTFFVCESSGYELAAQFGTKRFPISNARTLLNDKNAGDVKAIKFGRDFSFPLESIKNEKPIPLKVVGLLELLTLKQENLPRLYEDLAELFNRCSDFAPGKKEEYLLGGKWEDKYCRFNLDARSPSPGVVTDQLFLLDESSKIIGTISASIRVSENGNADVYVYDEIVNYHTRLNLDQIRELERLHEDTHLNEEKKKAAIAPIVDPIRLALMEPLFSAARQTIRQSLMRLHPKLSSNETLDSHIRLGLVRAFIRAADGQVQNHQSLGCRQLNDKNAIYVIHGPRTEFAALVDTHVKTWASQKLQLLSSGKTDVVNPDVSEGRWVSNKSSSPRMYAESSSFCWEWNPDDQVHASEFHP